MLLPGPCDPPSSMALGRICSPQDGTVVATLPIFHRSASRAGDWRASLQGAALINERIVADAKRGCDRAMRFDGYPGGPPRGQRADQTADASPLE
jgi:hypothetical protein